MTVRRLDFQLGYSIRMLMLNEDLLDLLNSLLINEKVRKKLQIENVEFDVKMMQNHCYR